MLCYFPIISPASEGLRLYLRFCHLSPEGSARKAEPLKEVDKNRLLVSGCGASPGGGISLKAHLASLVVAWASPSTLRKAAFIAVWPSVP